MRIAIHSDLHCEGYRLPSSFLEDQSFDVLVLAGDIVSSKTLDRLAAIRERVPAHKHILYVPGNHEYYKGCMIKTKEALKSVCDEYNITLLDQDTRVIDDVAFIGATGWSDLKSHPEIPDAEKRSMVQG